jgi:hypothetical protein
VRGRWLAGAQLRRLLRLAQQLLQASDSGRADSGPLQRALIDVAGAAGAAVPPATAAVTEVVDVLRAAEAAAARERAAQGYSFVALDESARFYSGLLAGRGRDCWPPVAAACGALADALGRAQVAIAGRVRGPVLRQAEELLVAARESPLAQQLCAAVADAKQAAAAGAGAGARPARPWELQSCGAAELPAGSLPHQERPIL